MPETSAPAKASAKFRLSSQHWSALFFGMAALVPIISWYILLFVAQPQSQSIFEAALFQLHFVFSAESPAPWWFVGWAALPFALAGLSFFNLTAASRRAPAALLALGASLAILVVSLFYWPVVTALTVAGSFNAFRSYRSAT